MLTLDELARYITRYSVGSASFEELEDWFEGNSAAAYADPDLSGAWADVDAVLSEYHFDGIGDDALRARLAAVVSSHKPVVHVAAAANVLPEYWGDPRRSDTYVRCYPLSLLHVNAEAAEGNSTRANSFMPVGQEVAV